MSETVTVHDFRRFGVGSDVCFRPSDSDPNALDAYGWTHAPLADGDVLLLPNKRSPRGYSRYTLRSFRREFDPSDMWFGKLHWRQTHFCDRCDFAGDSPDPSHPCAPRA